MTSMFLAVVLFTLVMMALFFQVERLIKIISRYRDFQDDRFNSVFHKLYCARKREAKTRGLVRDFVLSVDSICVDLNDFTEANMEGVNKVLAEVKKGNKDQQEIKTRLTNLRQNLEKVKKSVKVAKAKKN